ncbi:uncharacterized protein N7498_004140 [Penicillium cinerascens]|uniref:Major facilitator superfamily (MFS) profile domain-containing protein n=1 Tax=Penicillium cinerascens TaxID=70096 RepID=A0A9W9T7T1_9EURO|nr:uncharacterized protein N7498_004140 [Penicillium cinerascens]KAJ5212494.1 hypothetical protein N7498_004140 [Penicillium cinerascens]
MGPTAESTTQQVNPMTTSERLGSKTYSMKYVFRKMTWRLFWAWMVTALINVIFGYEVTSFGGVQSIPAFAKQFGQKTASGKYELSSERASYTASLAFVGKLVGSLMAPFGIERFGHRWTIWALVVIVWIGVVIESTSKEIAQFIIGRIVIYFRCCYSHGVRPRHDASHGTQLTLLLPKSSVGLAEVTSTSYQSEISPAAMRGTIVGSLQLFIQIGQIYAAGVNRAYSTSTHPSGWIIPVAIQAGVPSIVFVCNFFIPDSPRWLISKDRKEDAVKVLDIVRPAEDVRSGVNRLEVDAIEEAVRNDLEKAPWIELIRGVNLRRTLIGSGLLGLQQFLGQNLVSGYSPRFYATVGLSKEAFNYNIGSATVGWAGSLLGILLSDFLGRRDVLIWGAVIQSAFLFLITGVGLQSNPTTTDARALVAGVMLYFFFYSGTWGPLLFTVCSEAGNPALREKTLSLGVALNVITAFIVSFSVPYILDAIGSAIGAVFGGIAFFSAILVYFVLPETKDRSLEELDELFKAHVPARKFKTTRTYGAGSRVTDLENASYNEKLDRPTVEHEERVETINLQDV